MNLTLDKLKPGVQGVITAVNGQGAFRRRLFDLGLTPNTPILVRKTAPLGDPIEVYLRGFELTLRKSEAGHIQVSEVCPEDKTGKSVPSNFRSFEDAATNTGEEKNNV